MRSFISLAVVAANLAFSSAAAIPVQTRSTNLLAALGIKTGANSCTNSCSAWIGTDGAYQSEFINTSGETIELVIWGSAGSWVNVDIPLITSSINNGSSMTVSFASGTSGAWSAVYPDTALVNGQVSNTWGEFTFDGEFSTVDVSRLPNMAGHKMSIVTPECTSNMNTCVFTCNSGEICEFDYTLENCASGSQTGAMFGTYDGADSGGCLVGSSGKIVTTFA